MSPQWLVLPIALLIANAAAALSYDRGDVAQILAVLVIPGFLASLVSPLVFARKAVYGQIYFAGTSAFLGLTALCLATYGSYQSLSDLLFVPASILYVATVLGFLGVVPYAVLPYFRSRSGMPEVRAQRALNTGAISRSFGNIRSSFVDVQNAVSRETLAPEDAIQRLETQIAEQQGNLERVTGRLEATQEELAEYQALAQLTSAQKDAFVRLIGRRKYQDYLIGFLLGLLSSALVQAAASLLAQ